MTPKELYNWALRNDAEDLEIRVQNKTDGEGFDENDECDPFIVGGTDELFERYILV